MPVEKPITVPRRIVPRRTAPRLLAWYAVHARSLPWRSAPSTRPPDPYRVWLSEVMLQQTTTAAAAPYFSAFTVRWPDVAALAAADDADVMAAWAGLGYYARARNLLACARIVAAQGGRFPDDEAGLRALPGIGAYTAAAIAAIAFGRRAVVVDANVERVVARLFAIPEPLPAARAPIRAATDGITPDARAGDFAQAMMDLGATVCTPRTPRCLVCPLHSDCGAAATGDPAAYPVRPAKAARPVRHGTVFWADRGDAVLVVRRPPRGLLGGMLALPTGAWTDAPPDLAEAPLDADWRILPDSIEHGFTHFVLRLSLARADLAGDCQPPPGGQWWAKHDLASAGLPTLFAKAAAAFERTSCPAR